MNCKSNNDVFIYFLTLNVFLWQYGTGFSKSISFKNRDGIDEYDFIVGGGTAGCTVASRLSETGRYSVLVIEEGGVPRPELDIPGTLLKYSDNKVNFKNYYSVHQTTAAQGKKKGLMEIWVGRALGGSSSINGMMYNRGSPYDYDHWAEVTGDSSWKYENLLKYFKKIEDYRGKFPSESQHGTGGPLTISQPDYLPGRQEWETAARDMGYPWSDPNGPQKIGFSPAEYSKKFGRRVSAYSAYIRPFMDSRPYLVIETNSTVKRIIFKKQQNAFYATGVVYGARRAAWGGEQEVKALARREVIMAAGVYNTPAILMKSGIGPEDILSKANIPKVENLPVGQNYQDHAKVRLTFLLNTRAQVFVPETDLNPTTRAYYNHAGDGPYSAFINQLQVFLPSSVATPPPPTSSAAVQNFANPSKWADTQIVYGQTTMSPEKDKWYEVGSLYFEHIVYSFVVVARPKSSGRVLLNETDPIKGDPLIDFNFYSHPDDMTVMLEGIETNLKIFEKTSAFQYFGARYTRVPIDNCKQHKFRSESYWRCYIAQVTSDGGHGVGTCKMGKKGDPSAVVDSNLKVFRIKGLRVVDASIMPNVTNANTMASVYVIAEKAAAMILEEHDKLP